MHSPGNAAPSLVIAGGGTGGHLMPGLAVARALRAAGAGTITFVGTARGLEARLVPEAGYPLELISIGGLKGGGLGRRLATAARLPRAVRESARILRATGAQAVLGIGGYASGPTLAAAGLLRVPVVLLEVNAISGLANRWAGRWARAAAVNFPETAHDYRRAEVTGIPVRPEFFQARGQGGGGVLVTGGSQGAHAINEAVRALGASAGFRLLHQTGAADAPACAAAYAGSEGRARASAFLDDMPSAMGAADLAVCRAGASTLGELAAAGKPAILIPFPGAADQHQLHNAEAYARAGAAVLLPQSALTPERLRGEIEALLAAPERLRAMSEAVARFARPDAAERIAAMVLSSALPPRR